MFFGNQNFKNDIDPFSAVSSLFSGLALIGVVVAIMYQQRELVLQRKEMQNTREVFEIERFEITFFNLLNNHRQIISQIKYDFVNKYSAKEEGRWVDKIVKIEMFSGVDFFKKVREDLKNLYEISIEVQKANGLEYVFSKSRYVFSFNRYDNLTPHWLQFQISQAKKENAGLELDKHILTIIVNPIFNKYNEIFQYYFSNLVQSLIIIRDFTSESKAQTEEGKDKYLSIFKSQLTSYELSMLFYYVVNNAHLHKLFRDLSFFKELNVSNLLNKEHSKFFTEHSLS